MVDTQRSIAALQGLLADNASREISPQDVRDIVATLEVGRVQMYVSTAVETTISVIGTFVKVAGTTTLTTEPAQPKNWTMPVDNRITYGGIANRLAVVTCAISLQSVGTNVDLLWRLAKNGTTIADSEIQRRIVAAVENDAAALSGLVEVSTGDYIELWAANGTDTSNLTLTKMVMNVVDHAI